MWRLSCAVSEAAREQALKDIYADKLCCCGAMRFVMDAAAQFDQMLQDHRRAQLEQSIREIAAGITS